MKVIICEPIAENKQQMKNSVHSFSAQAQNPNRVVKLKNRESFKRLPTPLSLVY
jgi:hypothetical protein